MMASQPSSTSPRKLSALQQLKAAKKAELKKRQTEAAEQQSRAELASREGRVRGGVGLVYDDRMLLHHCPWDPHHIETPDRLRAVWARCRDLGLVDRCSRLPARAATDAELLSYHTHSFLETFASSAQLGAEEAEARCRELDSVYLSPDTDQAARLAAGASVDLVAAVLDNSLHCGLGLVRPPGHHAMADTPCGFCGYNNVVVAARAALDRGVSRVLIVDWDLHHGQGTQQAFYSDPRVLYMSVHRYERGKYWPHLRESNFDYVGKGAGAGYNVNVPLNTVDCGPADYLAVFHSLLLPLAAEFCPELVLVSAGYDAAVGCPEGEMVVTPATYAHLVHLLAGLAGGRLVVLLEGGYCLPSLAESAALSLRALLGDPCPPVATGPAKESVLESIRSCVTALRKYWKCLAFWPTAECNQPDQVKEANGSSGTEDSIVSRTEDKTEEKSEIVANASHDPQFEPVVPLPDLAEVTTGEEGEVELFRHRAKLYRYCGAAKQWMDASVGSLKLLHAPDTGVMRLLLRREDGHKIAANHRVTREMELRPLAGSEAAWCWHAMDFSEWPWTEESGTLEHLAVRFKTKETADKFKAKFEECQSNLGRADVQIEPYIEEPAKTTESTEDYQKSEEVSATVAHTITKVHVPDLTFSPPADWPPEEFPTRDYYLVYDEATADFWRKEVAKLVLDTDLRCAATKLGVLYDPEMMRHRNELEDEDDHPECPERIQRIFEAIEAAGIMEREETKRLPCGRQLAKEECCLVHEEEHWTLIQETRDQSVEDRNLLAEAHNSIYLNQFSAECGLLSAGGVLTSVEAVVRGDTRSALAVVRPPGHHAEPDEPHGFCLFNNVAIAAKFAIQNLGLQRVLILDWDVHHGNGIQHMFYDDPSVLYISLHRYDNGAFFPQSEDADYDKVGEGAGLGYNVNIPWNGRRMGDAEYNLAFQNIVLPIGYEFRPDLVLVSAGFDAAVGDPLGGYRVTPAMYGHMTHQLAALAGGRVVVALEGGYNLASISECATACARALLGDPLPLLKVKSRSKNFCQTQTFSIATQVGAPRREAVDTVRSVVKQQRPHWSCLAAADTQLPLSLPAAAPQHPASADLVSALDSLSLAPATSSPSRSVQRSQLQAANSAQ